jgi:hypothetical protein
MFENEKWVKICEEWSASQCSGQESGTEPEATMMMEMYALFFKV